MTNARLRQIAREAAFSQQRLQEVSTLERCRKGARTSAPHRTRATTTQAVHSTSCSAKRSHCGGDPAHGGATLQVLGSTHEHLAATDYLALLHKHSTRICCSAASAATHRGYRCYCPAERPQGAHPCAHGLARPRTAHHSCRSLPPCGTMTPLGMPAARPRAVGRAGRRACAGPPRAPRRALCRWQMRRSTWTAPHPGQRCPLRQWRNNT